MMVMLTYLNGSPVLVNLARVTTAHSTREGTMLRFDEKDDGKPANVWVKEDLDTIRVLAGALSQVR